MTKKKSKKSNGKPATTLEGGTTAVASEPLSLANSEAHKGIKIGPVYVDGFLHFSPFDLTRYELAQARVLNALQAIGLKKAEMDQAKREFEDKARRLNAEMQAVGTHSQGVQDELKVLQRELESLYQLDFSNVSYDNMSGKISVLGEPVPE